MKNKKLHNIKETGLKVPKDYFDNLEDTVLRHIKLKELSSESGFKTPKNYFDTLEDSILSKTSEKEHIKVISLFSRRNLIYASSIAAAILLLFNLSISEKKSDWDKLDSETVENYIIEENIGSYEIASLLSEDSFIEDDFAIHSLNQENVENYLLDNLDIDDLIIE